MDNRITNIISKLENGEITYNEALNNINNLKFQKDVTPKKRNIFGAPKKIRGIKIQIKYYDDENEKFKHLNIPGIPLWLVSFMSNFVPITISSTTKRDRNYYINSSNDNNDEDIVVIEESSNENHGKSVKKNISFSQFNIDKKTMKKILKEIKYFEPFNLVTVDTEDAKVIIKTY